MKKTLFMLFALAVCFSGRSLYANNILFTENFETATAGLTLTTAGQFSAINGTNIDVVSAASGWATLVVPPEAGNVVDLGGSGGNPFGQLQSVPIVLNPGKYLLSFDLVGSQRGVQTTTNVALGPSGGPDLYNQNFTLASNDDTSGIVTDVLLNVVGSPETVNLTFTLVDGAYNIGSLLDNVSITSAATPEPGSLLLLGSGLTVLAGLLRRRFSVHRA